MTDIETLVLSALDRVDTVALLRNLVAIPSLVGSEAQLAEAIGILLADEGFHVEYQQVEQDRRNVIARQDFSRPGPCLMFNGHLDTVAPTSHWDGDPFTADIRGERLYGLGALDMKGGIAASLSALQAAMTIKEHLCGSIVFSGVVDEEGCSSGARALLERGLDDVDAVVIGEPCGSSSEFPIPTITAGKVLYRLTVEGKQAHGFMPSAGINAAEEMAVIISSLAGLHQLEHEVLGTGPICTLKISGGYEQYAVVVPEHCEAIISRMIVPGEDSGSCKADLEALVCSLDLAAEVTVEVIPPYYVPLQTNTSHRLFTLFDDVHRKEYGCDPCYGPSMVITDASVFCGEGGLPTLVFGPSGGAIHQANEFVDLGSLESCTRAYALTAARFLEPKTPQRRQQ